MIQFYSKENIDQCVFPEDYNGQYAKKYLLPILKNGVHSYISNIQTELYILKIDTIIVPVTVNEEEYENSYVVSPYTHYVSYAIEELVTLPNKTQRKVFKSILTGLGRILKTCKINKVVHVNNWMLSTNLYRNLSLEQLDTMTAFLIEKFPSHSIVFRSINSFSTKDIYRSLEGLHYTFIASRQVYFAQHKSELKKRQREDIRRDMSLLKKHNYEVLDLTNEEFDSTLLLSLYNLLYIDKYSTYNPRFTERYLRLSMEQNLFNFKIAKLDGVIEGFYGNFERNGIVTTPLLGYTTSIDLDKGLYRVLTVTIYNEAEEGKKQLHLSSGAAEFKKNRGALPTIEYNAVYLKHLPFKQRIGWKLLQILINKIAVPVLKKNGL